MNDGRIVPLHIADLYRQAAVRFGNAPAFCRRRSDKSWEELSFSALHELGVDLATGLIELGVGARSHVGLISDNRMEWILCDCAIQLAGAADVPRGTDITDAEITHILSHADVEILIVENESTLEKFERCRKHLRHIREVVVMDPKFPTRRGVHRLDEILERGRALRREGDRRVEDRVEAIRPDDLFTLIYTSGTTGTPKGVMLTHANMVSQIRNLPFPLKLGDRALSILPIWHSYERVFEMVALSWGVCTHYTSLRTIAEDLRSVRPNVMASAPRLWESLYQKILANLRSSSPIRRFLFQAAYGAARRFHRASSFLRAQEIDLSGRSPLDSIPRAFSSLLTLALYYLPYRLLDHLVLRKLRLVVGGEFRGTISGGGALQPHVDEFYNFIGIPVLEGYGMTETAPVLAVRTWENLILGTVGLPFPETEVRIVDLQSGEILHPNRRHRGNGAGLRGEIHVRGPQVMRGYYKNPEATAQVLRDGWMNTGDIGLVTFNGCLKILGRSKETIVLLSGENVEPVPIEGRLIESPLIDQVMVIGQDQKGLAALIVPNLEALREAGYSASSPEALRLIPEVRELMDGEVRRLICAETGFKPFERITDWRFLPAPFQVGEELTNTFKLKRHVIGEKYAAIFDEIYGG